MATNNVLTGNLMVSMFRGKDPDLPGYRESHNRSRDTRDLAGPARDDLYFGLLGWTDGAIPVQMST